MSDLFSHTILWWVVTVDIPIFTAVLVMMARIRRHFDERQEILRETLANYKLEVAQSYASINQLKDLESRVIAHLLRIETKLDHTALKAHALLALSPQNSTNTSGD